MEVIVFKKTKEPFGWLSNMSAFQIAYGGLMWRNAEALFQALRFDDPSFQDSIRQEKSPMAAKFVAKANIDKMIVVPQSEQDLNNMRLVLRLKVEQHSELKTQLLETADAIIIEDCTSRPHGSGTFWGAVWSGSEWSGENVLGKLWMELRTELLK